MRTSQITTSSTFSLDIADLKRRGIILNPARLDFEEMFLSDAFQQEVGKHMNERFKSGNDGKWTISQKWSDEKVRMGYHPEANRMSGAVHKAMAHPASVSIRVDDVSDAIALRKASKKSMQWGVDLTHSRFADGDYASEIAKKNPFAFIGNILSAQLSEIAAEFLLEMQKRSWETAS